MIYVCVPVHNEASTVGLVLWKVRQVFTAFQREYQIIACDACQRILYDPENLDHPFEVA